MGSVKLHRNWASVTAQALEEKTYLVVGPLSVFGSTVDILVDTSSVDHSGVDVELGVLSRVGRDVVTFLERGLNEVGPFLVGDHSLLSIDWSSALFIFEAQVWMSDVT